MTTLAATDTAHRFLDALGRRDDAALASTFATHGRLRGLVPTGLREAEGPDAIAERYRIWTAEEDDWERRESEAEELADVVRPDA